MIVPCDIREKLQGLSAFEFYETQLVQTELVGHELIVNQLPETEERFFWAKPKVAVVAGVSGTANETCAECGLFTGPRQLTRLLIKRNDVPDSGIFSVSQNGDPQIFVSEEAKQQLSSLGVEAGFYSAGRIE